MLLYSNCNFIYLLQLDFTMQLDFSNQISPVSEKNEEPYPNPNPTCVPPTDDREAPKVSPPPTLGFCQYCNFGKKHRGRTWYDIANIGDFGYLKFISKLEKLNPNCKPHVDVALLSEHVHGPWIMQQENIDNVWFEKWFTNGDLQGPRMKYKMCPDCSRLKNEQSFVSDSSLCFQCRKNFKQQQEQFIPSSYEPYYYKMQEMNRSQQSVNRPPPPNAPRKSRITEYKPSYYPVPAPGAYPPRKRSYHQVYPSRY